MKKLLCVVCLLLVAALLLTGCQAPEKASDEPTATPTPKPTAEYIPWTPEPTVTPRALSGAVETPAANATPFAIDPADLPSRPPLGYELEATYVTVTEPALELSFNVPADWYRDTNSAPNEAIYVEPENNIRSGEKYPSKIYVQVIKYNSATTEKDAKDQIDTILSGLLDDENVSSPDFSEKATYEKFGAVGWYSTYRVTYKDPVTTEEMRLRGRCLVIPKDTKLYVVRFICPALFNTDYINVFYEVRKSMKITT